MDVKLTITNVCGARCATCPSWKQPERTMSYEKFVELWEILNTSPEVDRILINNVGDVNELENSLQYLTHMEKRNKRVIMTTNGKSLVYVPKVDEMIISFNGGTKETYEYTTGLNFESVRDNIRAAYSQLALIPYVRLDCLMWEGNKGTESEFIRMWNDFPGHIRLGYKAENQGDEYFGLEEFKDVERIPCDYLDLLSIAPNGNILSCAHDFAESTNYGNIFTDGVKGCLENPARLKKKAEHEKGIFTGNCEKCNYNVTTEGKFFYVK